MSTEPYDWKSDAAAVLAHREFKGLTESIAVEVDAFVDTLDGASYHDPDALDRLVAERAKALRAALPRHIAKSDQELRNEAARAIEPELITAAQHALRQTEAAVQSFNDRIAGWEEEAARVVVPEIDVSDVELFHQPHVLESRKVQRMLAEAAARDHVRELTLDERLELHASTKDPLLIVELERQLRRQLAKPTTDADLPAGLTPEQKATALPKLERQRQERIAALDAAAAARIAPWKRERLAELRKRRDGWVNRISPARRIVLLEAQTGRIALDQPALKRAREQRTAPAA